MRTALQTVVHDATHPSHVVLPVIPRHAAGQAGRTVTTEASCRRQGRDFGNVPQRNAPWTGALAFGRPCSAM
jgi:hypothetical protein